MKYTLRDLLIDLYLDDEIYKDYVKEYKKDFKKVLQEINKDKELIPVLESDLEREKEFLEECHMEMLIIKNINGIILYKKKRV